MLERWLLLIFLVFQPRSWTAVVAGRLKQVPFHRRPTDDVVLDQRDDLLLETLSRLHLRYGAEPISVAVVYGAAHMRAVVRKMRKRFGYRPVREQRLEVFSLRGATPRHAPLARRLPRIVYAGHDSALHQPAV